VANHDFPSRKGDDHRTPLVLQWASRQRDEVVVTPITGKNGQAAGVGHDLATLEVFVPQSKFGPRSINLELDVIDRVTNPV
jgi:hypothetical protein